MKTQEQIIRELIGKTCWRAWRGVGTAVFFEFGEKLADRKVEKLEKAHIPLDFRVHGKFSKII